MLEVSMLILASKNLKTQLAEEAPSDASGHLWDLNTDLSFTQP